MWMARPTVRRRHAFIVLAILLFILGPLAIMRTATGIYPRIDIPVVSVA